MFLIWTSDHAPYKTNSMASRWPIAVFPASLYKIDADGVNLTIQSATREIVAAFNRLGTEGIKVRDFRSMGGGLVT